MRLLSIFVLTLGIAASAHADRILIVGDSLSCGHFGNNLIADLASQGHEVKMYCAVGSSPDNWLDGHPARASWPCEIHTFNSSKVSNRAVSPHVEAVQSKACGGFPKFSKILGDNPSDKLIVALGTNSLPDGPDDTYDRMLDAIAVSHRSCDWILPPHLEPSRAGSAAVRKAYARKDAAVGTTARPGSFYRSLNEKLNGRCGSISSLAATAPGTPGNETGEGLHQTKTAGRYRFMHMKQDIDRALAAAPKSGAGSPGHPANSRH